MVRGFTSFCGASQNGHCAPVSNRSSATGNGTSIAITEHRAADSQTKSVTHFETVNKTICDRIATVI